MMPTLIYGSFLRIFSATAIIWERVLLFYYFSSYLTGYFVLRTGLFTMKRSSRLVSIPESRDVVTIF